MNIFQQNIRKMSVGVKGLLENQSYYMAIVLLLVAISAFGLGRQSVEVVGETQIANIPTPNLPLSTTTESLPSTYYVASKNGQVYHLPHCSGAQRISEANKIIFNSKAEAEAAGLRPAANCKGI